MFSCKLGYYGNRALLNDQSNYSIWDSYDLKNTFITPQVEMLRFIDPPPSGATRPRL